MLRKLKVKIAHGLANFIYYRIASKLPSSYNARTGFPKKLRAWCGKFLLDRCGKNVNIEKKCGAALGRY